MEEAKGKVKADFGDLISTILKKSSKNEHC
jgi:hypothetical protein